MGFSVHPLPVRSGLSAGSVSHSRIGHRHGESANKSNNKVEVLCGAGANVQFNMTEDDDGKLGPAHMNRIATVERAQAVNMYGWMIRWNLRAANTFSYVDG